MTALVDQPTITAPLRWTDLLLPHLPTVPPRLVEQVLLAVLRDFCREGGVWQGEAVPITIQSGQSVYPVVAPFETVEVGFVLLARGNDGTLWCPQDSQTSWVARGMNFSAGFSCPQPDVIQFPINAIKEVTTITPFITMVPNTTEVPDWFRLQHELPIVKGVLAEMWAMPGKPWTNAKGAESAAYVYRTMKKNARMRAYKGNTTAPRPWMYPRGWP